MTDPSPGEGGDRTESASPPVPPPATAMSGREVVAPFLMPPDIQKTLSPMALQALARMSSHQQATFLHMYNGRKRSVGAMMALAILFPIQLFLLGQTGLAVAFLLTSGGCGIWYLVEIFLTPGRVRTHNQTLADLLLLQMKAME